MKMKVSTKHRQIKENIKVKKKREKKKETRVTT